jgi:hypothetical protein
MHACEVSIFDRLTELVEGHKKLDGIILDESMPFEMGQIIHKVFNATKNHACLLETSYLVVSPVMVDEKWRSVLVDRFRTEMTLFDPAHRATFQLLDGNRKDEWCIFSSADKDFFRLFTNALTSIISNSRYEDFDVLQVENGMKNLIPEFKSKLKDLSVSKYDKSDAARHWSNQKPLAYQCVVQMAAAIPKSPLRKGERVLLDIERTMNPFNKHYHVGTVLDRHNHDDETYLVHNELDEDDDIFELVHRRHIRKLSQSELKGDHFNQYEEGDVILYEIEPGEFLNGVIVERTGEDKYSLYTLDYFKARYYDVPASRLLYEIEPAEQDGQFGSISSSSSKTQLTLPTLVRALERSLLVFGITPDAPDGPVRRSTRVGDGAVESVFWPHGNVVMKWDGSHQVEINLFLREEVNDDDVGDQQHVESNRMVFQETLLKELPNLSIVALDEFPRGVGSVVNLAVDMSVPPHWISQYETKTIRE